jgi:hypothetical protein
VNNNEEDEDDTEQEHPYDIQIVQEDEDGTPPLQDSTPLYTHLAQVEQDSANNDDDSQRTGVAPENSADEVNQSSDSDDDDVDNNDVTTTRSGTISPPLDRESEYPGIYYSNGEILDGRCLKPFYLDDDFQQRIAEGNYYSNQYFVDNVTEKQQTLQVKVQIKLI